MKYVLHKHVIVISEIMQPKHRIMSQKTTQVVLKLSID